MALDFNLLEKAYFYFDKPVPYKLNNEKNVLIKPIYVPDEEIFLASANILQIDKNSSSSVEIIQMSYLDFLIDILLPADESGTLCDKLYNILHLCLGIEDFWIKTDDKGRHSLYVKKEDIEINRRQFDDIRRIIMYQNILGYDDEYIDPEIKAMMAKVDQIKSGDIEMPSIERQFAIVTAHCGLSKSEQMKMTMRSHQLLFKECAAEVDFITIRPIALNNGKAKDLEHWIFRKKHDKFDGYMVSMKDYKKSFGGEGNISQMDSNGEIAKLLSKQN